MGFSLYYEAKREQPLTEHEKAVSGDITEKYCSQYPFKRKVEDFGVNDLNDQDQQEHIIFSGSTKLPGTSPKVLFDVANYWLKCLTEITLLLANAEWSATFDDVDLICDPEEGWRFPTDEEYKAGR